MPKEKQKVMKKCSQEQMALAIQMVRSGHMSKNQKKAAII